MRVTVEVEIAEIRDRFDGAVSGDVTATNEPSESLCHLDVDEMGSMELVLAAKDPRPDPVPERRPQQHLQER